VAGGLKARPEELPGRVAGLQAELRSSEKQVAELRSQLAIVKSEVWRARCRRRRRAAATSACFGDCRSLCTRS
jgi:hypothetical protein